MTPGMPGGPPPTGGAGTGAATAPGPMAGSAQQGLTGVKVGLEALQKALPMLPMGSELHSKVMKAISSISEHLAEGAGQGGNQIQALMEMMRNAKTQGGPNMGAMMPGGPSGAGGGIPSPPAMGGSGAPPIGPM